MSESHAAEVQAELQQYLNSKNINSLFIAIVENMLIEKPSNPIAFMIEYLVKNYPDQAKVALDGSYFSQTAHTVPTENKADVKDEAKSEKIEFKKDPKSDSKVTMKLEPIVQKYSARKDDDTDDDDGDAYGEASPVSKSPASRSRRASVSSESMDAAKLKEHMSQLASIPKDVEVEKHLLEVISKSTLLKSLDGDQKDLIIKAFAGPVEVSKGEDIIVQGDMGDIFYLIEDGHVDVYIKKKDQNGDFVDTKVHTYNPGNSFGELAIMYNTPRAATCRAQTDCVLWTLDRVSFKAIIVSANMQKRELFQGFLKQIPILESLTEMEIMTLADSLVEERYDDDQKVCCQGESGDYFYIIKSGSAVCSQTDTNGEEKVVANLKIGDYFGEIALLTNKPRQATVTAHDNLMVLSIDRATFSRVLGCMDKILQRNMTNYTKYSDS